MKTQLNILRLWMVLLATAVCCTLPRGASAQSDDNSPPYNQEDKVYGNDGNDEEYYDEDNDYSNGDEEYQDDDYQEDYEDERNADVNINIFESQLSPYGRWVVSPSYGRVWVCNEAGFRPYYSNGHWVYTRYGWTWVSGYRWGWAPFHYGRWAYETSYGWMWVPGYQWGPAWVCWRNGGGYYGWAPIGPRVSINIGFGFGRGIGANYWCFAPNRYINRPYVGRYCVNRGRNVTIIRNTTIINNTTIYNNRRYVGGPSRVEVERNTGKRVNVTRINQTNKPGGNRIANNAVDMYRPTMKHKNQVQNNRPGQQPNVKPQPQRKNDAVQSNNNSTIKKNKQQQQNGDQGRPQGNPGVQQQQQKPQLDNNHDVAPREKKMRQDNKRQADQGNNNKAQTQIQQPRQKNYEVKRNEGGSNKPSYNNDNINRSKESQRGGGFQPQQQQRQNQGGNYQAQKRNQGGGQGGGQRKRP